MGYVLASLVLVAIAALVIEAWLNRTKPPRGGGSI